MCAYLCARRFALTRCSFHVSRSGCYLHSCIQPTSIKENTRISCEALRHVLELRCQHVSINEALRGPPRSCGRIRCKMTTECGWCDRDSQAARYPDAAQDRTLSATPDHTRHVALSVTLPFHSAPVAALRSMGDRSLDAAQQKSTLTLVFVTLTSRRPP